MRTWLVVSMLMHSAFGWFLYAKLLMPPRIPLATPIVLNLIAAPEPPKAAPKPPPPVVQPKVEPQEAPRPKVVKSTKPPSPLERLLDKVKRQRRKRDRVEPTPTPLRIAAVPTVPPEEVPVAKRIPTPRAEKQDVGPVHVEGPAGAYRYDYYLGVIRNTLRRNWTVPQVPNLEKCMTVVEMTLSRDGRVLGHQVRSSSGNRFFDQSVEDAIRASTFPQFADDYKDSRMTVTVRFRPVRR